MNHPVPAHMETDPPECSDSVSAPIYFLQIPVPRLLPALCKLSRRLCSYNFQSVCDRKLKHATPDGNTFLRTLPVYRKQHTE